MFSPLTSGYVPNINADMNNYVDQNSNLVMSVTSFGHTENEDSSAMDFSNHKYNSGNLN